MPLGVRGVYPKEETNARRMGSKKNKIKIKIGNFESN